MRSQVEHIWHPLTRVECQRIGNVPSVINPSVPTWTLNDYPVSASPGMWKETVIYDAVAHSFQIKWVLREGPSQGRIGDRSSPTTPVRRDFQ